MADNKMSVAASPGGLASPRKLSRKPMIILGVLVVGLVLLFIWTTAQKGKDLESKRKDEQPVKLKAANNTASLLGNIDEGQVTAPSGVSLTLSELLNGEHELFTRAEEPKPATPEKPEPTVIMSTPAPGLPVANQPNAAELAALERLERARQRAYDDYTKALIAPMAVQHGLSQTVQNTAHKTEGGAGSDDTGLHREALERLRQQQLEREQRQQAMLTAALGAFGNRGTANPVTINHQPAVNARKTGERRKLPAKAETVLTVGTVIPSILKSGINSDLPGDILAQVSEDVFDSRAGQHILIPKGSELVGRYSSNIEEGQERVAVIWYRINYPDSSTLDLGAMLGTDLAGYSGLQDQVDRHTVDKFKEASLLSLISGAAQLSQAGKDEAAQQMLASMGQGWAQVGQELVKRKLDRAPTIIIRPGLRFNVFINQDVVLDPYHSQ